MLKFTEAARRVVLEFAEEMENPGIRIAVGESGPDASAAEFDLSLVDASRDSGDDVVVDFGEYKVFIEPDSLAHLDGATVDYTSGAEGAGFRITPAGSAAGVSDSDLAERVRRVIDERINPALAGHGGQITLIGCEDNVVLVEMGGGCQGCGMARMTLKQGVERMIREAVPEVVEIQDVTDHSTGLNPYYSR